MLRMSTLGGSILSALLSPRLLKVWRPITLEVSLELLDYHFADDKVRSLAVRQLETLTNDELLCYLLQLIQVCPCLGTVLIKRNLTMPAQRLHSTCVTHLHYALVTEG